MKYIRQILYFIFLTSSLLQGSENPEMRVEATSRIPDPSYIRHLQEMQAIHRYHKAEMKFLTELPPPHKCPQCIQSAIVRTKKIVLPCYTYIVSGCSILCPETKPYERPEIFTPDPCEKCLKVTESNCLYHFCSFKWWDDAKEYDAGAKDDNV
ncbi:MAG: hypothetical protein Q8Q60_01530 [Candidatus Chromulinivorax sp.]|nr:hypothetical protein [Candidatus Chromulinivorax sp.]